MIRRIATLLGLIGLAGLVILAAALTSGCGTPLTKGGFQQNLAHGLGPFHGRLDALDRKVTALEESTAANFAVVDTNFQTLAGGVEQATKRAEAAKSLGETTVKLLGPIGRDASVASKEAAAGRKAVENVAANVKAARAETTKEHEGLGVGIANVGQTVLNEARDTSRAIADVGQKVDRRADEVVSAIGNVDQKVDSAAADAKTAHVAFDQKVQEIGDGLLDRVDHRAEQIRKDVGEVDKKVADHADEAEKARQAILRLLSSIPPPPAPGHP